MSNTTPPITDLAKKAVSELAEGQPESISRAEVFSRLAVAQQQKVANIISYLNSDVSTWSAEDEVVVRHLLGLTAGIEPEPEPEPEPEAEPEPQPVLDPVDVTFDLDTF